jgi:hypothetical protein
MDQKAVDTRSVKYKPIPKAEDVDAATAEIEKDTWHVHASFPPIEIHKHTNTMHVYGVPDDHGRIGYFKPKESETWKAHGKTGTRSFKSSIREGALPDREILVSKIARLLGITNVPTTKWARIKHRGEDLGRGSLHMDPLDLLSNRGYTHNQGDFYDWHAKNREEHGRIILDNREVLSRMKPTQGLNNELVELTANRVRTALKNGGLDLSVFDYIVGNADRHGKNFFAGTNPETGECAFIGSSHILCFPNETHFFYPDYVDSINGLWKITHAFGQDVPISDTLAEKLRDTSIVDQVKQVMEGVGLKNQEKAGVLARLKKVQARFEQNQTLKGSDLIDILNKSVYGAEKLKTEELFD